MYTIRVQSHYEQMWRYNLMAMCAGYDAAGERLYVASAERVFNDDLNRGRVKLPPAPLDFVVGEPFVLECGAAESIHLIVYAVTHTLPEDRDVEQSPPFDMRITIERGSQMIYDQLHEVNQWGGATVDIEM
ncbi:MAG: hypothetical protein SNH63_04985 [Rikenellaceae bacterium]